MFAHLKSFVAAAVQHPPVFLDLEKSVDRACELIALAGELSAKLVVFPESWLPGYPVWLDVAPGAALWDHAPAKEVFGKLFSNSVEIPGQSVTRLCEAAKAAGTVVVMGTHERAQGTLYNTMLYIADDGQVLGKHRKLMPTYSERLLWGQGDGSTLTVVDTPIGRVGGLICWEHWMPLARYAIHVQQELVHVAQWPSVKDVHLVASRSYAFEGQCFVIAAGTVLQKQDLEHLNLSLLQDMPGEPDHFLMQGGSAIIAPNGECLTGPLFEEPGLLTAVIEPQLAIDGRLVLDIAGHYARADVFQLQVNTTPLANVRWQKEGPPEITSGQN
jgi:predicted amidohydrolase